MIYCARPFNFTIHFAIQVIFIYLHPLKDPNLVEKLSNKLLKYFFDFLWSLFLAKKTFMSLQEILHSLPLSFSSLPSNPIAYHFIPVQLLLLPEAQTVRKIVLVLAKLL